MPTLGDLVERRVKYEEEEKTILLRRFLETQNEYKDALYEAHIADEKLKRVSTKMNNVEQLWIRRYGCACELHGITCPDDGE